MYCDLFAGIFHGIVYQVVQDVAQMHPVCIDGEIRRNINSECHILFRFHPVLFYNIIGQCSKIDVFTVKDQAFPAFHTHRQDLLDKSAQMFQLALRYLEIFPSLLRRVFIREVQQGIIGCIGDRYRGLEFVSHIVGEVRLHVIERLLSADDVYQIQEDCDKDDKNQNRGDKDSSHLLQDSLSYRLNPQSVHCRFLNIEDVFK